MNKQLPLKRIAAASLGAVLLSATAGALADPPSRIARLAYIDGPVSFAPAGDNTWDYAAVNRPLIAGDRLWVEAGGRDEVQVGGAALRMGGNTLVTLLNIDDRTTQLQLSQGRLNVRVRKLRPNEVFEIDTPNLALSIRQPGDYKIDVDPVGNVTMVAVPRGQAEAYGDGNAYRLGSGQAYVFGGTDLRDARPVRPDLNDDFDRWAQSRDRRIEQARSARYVSPDLIGYEDLDDQGNWTTVPSYGNVWMPSHVARDWAPYRDGHWSYVQPWGWTWVDDAPWGFAVSHYGRWARFPQGWGWVPGPRAASPVYAPALVAFVSFGAGAYAQRERPVAWFPLAPREVYRPSYRASPNYVTNINVTNTALDRHQIPREGSRVEYANRRVGGAVTAVPASAFARSQPVSRSAVALPMAALAGAAIAHVAPVAPERDGRRGRGNPGHQPPQAVMERQVLARNAPPAEFRQAPRPHANNAAPAPQMAGPAPRVLQQDRHGGGHQLRDMPMQQQPAVAGPNGAPPAMPPQERGRFDRSGDQRMQRGQHGASPMPGQPGVAPVAIAPMPQQGRGRDRTEQPAPAAALRDQQNAQDAHRRGMRPEQGGQQRIDQQAAAQQQQQRDQRQAAQQQHNQQQAAEQHRGQQRAEAEQRQRQQQQAAEQQRNQQQAAEQQRNQQHPAEQQRNQQQAADQQRNQQQAAEHQRNQQQAEAQQRQRQQQQAAEQQRNQQQAAEHQRQQHAAEQQRAQQRDQQQAAAAQQRVQQQQAAEQQRSQQQAAAQQQRAQQQAAAEPRHAERAQRREPPPPPQAAPAPAAAQPASASQPVPANEAKKEERRHREHPAQN